MLLDCDPSKPERETCDELPPRDVSFFCLPPLILFKPLRIHKLGNLCNLLYFMFEKLGLILRRFRFDKLHYYSLRLLLNFIQLRGFCMIFFVCLVGWLVGVLKSSSTTRLYRGRASRQSFWQFYVLPHMRQSWETMTSVLAGHIILTPTQPIGSGRPQRESNPGPPHQESRALPTELPRPPILHDVWYQCHDTYIWLR